MIPGFCEKHKETLLYACFMGIALVIFRFLETRFFFLDYSTEFFVGGLALLFTALGVWGALKFVKPKTIVIERKLPEPQYVPDTASLEAIGMSKRELEVLQLMAKGHSNSEIASALFVSLNTVKTHASKIFGKLDVSRRTQAIEKAKQLGLLGQTTHPNG